MEISTLYQIFLNCGTVTTDSRNCPKGSLFIALKGDSFNGNAFAAQALNDGCAYAVIDETGHNPKDDERYILVDNCLETLQQLANYHRRQLGTRIIGITGTNGKTTTKELISAVLSQSYHVLYTLGNLNNHIGVPTTLLRLKAEHDLAVIEMGANHPGEIKFLSNIAEPDYGIITNVGKAHLEGFGSFEGVIKTKGELYDFLRKKENSTIFIHHDNPYLMNIASGLNKIFYGSEENLYINGRVTGNSPYLTFEWKAGKDGEKHEVQTQLIGEYNFPNALAAITIGTFFGVEADKINEALSNYTPQNNRSQLKKTRKSFDTKKAERWFKERRIKYQYIDLDSKGLSPGEYRSIRAAVGYDALVDRDSPDYRELGIDYLLPQAAEEKLLENPWLFRAPIVRNGRQATVGYCPDVWKTWE